MGFDWREGHLPQSVSASLSRRGSVASVSMWLEYIASSQLWHLVAVHHTAYSNIAHVVRGPGDDVNIIGSLPGEVGADILSSLPCSRCQVGNAVSGSQWGVLAGSEGWLTSGRLIAKLSFFVSHACKMTHRSGAE